MADLSTKYMGLELANPIVAASSSLANSVEGVKKLEKAGVGAVVLKSLFEEQIYAETEQMQGQGVNLYDTEAAEFIEAYGREFGTRDYLKLIQDAKKECKIPIIASLNCFSEKWWVNYAKKVEAAGADGLELNIGVLPSDPLKTAQDVEAVYLDIVKIIKQEIKIPVALKIGANFSSFANLATALSRGKIEAREFIVGWCGRGAAESKPSWNGVNALVLFNRYYNLDIDIDKVKLVAGNPFSSADEIHESLRWISLLSGRVECDLAASTGIHDGKGVIKQLLAGANAVQVCSVLYQKGLGAVQEMLEEVKNWMAAHKYQKIADFRGALSQKKSEFPAAHERLQYIKLFVGIE
ncbi:MAG: dihydroorotate dehydrogenase-like protein [Deltaproteobacteria bacterium]|nr:dihydroorotate dehydrogenase-like protein [Deltaproteobacteria bacterium]